MAVLPLPDRSTAAAAGEPSTLRVEGLTVRFGGVVAVNDVSFAVAAGTVMGIIGPNGAGKTTLFDAVCGFVDSRGRVEIEGRRVDNLAPFRRAAAGLGRSFQDGRLFPSLVVRDALAVAMEGHIPRVGPISAALRVGASAYVEKRVHERVDELIELLGLDAYANKFVSELSTGTRRVVDLGAVLAHQPRVLLLDEPSSGIAQRETEALAPLIKGIRAQLGCTILLIEHDMPLVISVADELLALELGAVIARGSCQDVVTHPRVVSSYLGGDERAIRRSGLGAQSAQLSP
jgi:branched-chain amino acid transport system ATP-binding protein